MLSDLVRSSKKCRLDEIGLSSQTTCMVATNGVSGNLSIQLQQETLAVTNGGISKSNTAYIWDDEKLLYDTPTVSFNLVVRRRLIHVKREARGLHASIHNSQSDCLNESNSTLVSEMVGVAGLVLPPPSK